MGPEYEQLVNPPRLYGREEVLGRESPVPRLPGVYAWYFDEIPPGVPTDGCRVSEAGTLLYVGIARRPPPANGSPPSQQTLRQRVRYHLRGNAAGSTLRLTLGCHLSERLEIALRRVGPSGKRLTFTREGEQRLNEWLEHHARVAWVVHETPWVVEQQLIEGEMLPLNIAHNADHPYYATLRALHASHKAAARALPVVSF